MKAIVVNRISWWTGKVIEAPLSTSSQKRMWIPKKLSFMGPVWAVPWHQCLQTNSIWPVLFQTELFSRPGTSICWKLSVESSLLKATANPKSYKKWMRTTFRCIKVCWFKKSPINKSFRNIRPWPHTIIMTRNICTVDPWHTTSNYRISIWPVLGKK